MSRDCNWEERAKSVIEKSFDDCAKSIVAWLGEGGKSEFGACDSYFTLYYLERAKQKALATIEYHHFDCEAEWTKQIEES